MKGLNLSLMSLLSLSLLLSGCNTNNKDKEELSYEDFINYKIEAKDFYNINKEEYYIYIYQIACPPCSYLKDLLFDLLNKNPSNFFIYDGGDYLSKDKDLFKVNNKDKSDEELILEMLGVNTTKDTYIFKSPSLYIINNNKLKNVLLDVNEIEKVLINFKNPLKLH